VGPKKKPSVSAQGL